MLPSLAFDLLLLFVVIVISMAISAIASCVMGVLLGVHEKPGVMVCLCGFMFFCFFTFMVYKALGSYPSVDNNGFFASLLRICTRIWGYPGDAGTSFIRIIAAFLLRIFLVVAAVLAVRRMLGMMVYEADGLRQAFYFDIYRFVGETDTLRGCEAGETTGSVSERMKSDVKQCFTEESSLEEDLWKQDDRLTESDLREPDNGINRKSPYFARKTGIGALLALFGIKIP